MGWLADKNEETDTRVAAVVAASIPPGETLQGAAVANRVSTFSGKMYAIGVTESHLVLVPLDRKLTPAAPAVVLRQDELEVGNIFSEGTSLLHTGAKDLEMRFTGRGEKYRFMMLGGTMLENALAGDRQVAGVHAIADFLRRSPQR